MLLAYLTLTYQTVQLVISFCQKQNVGLVVVGPEMPLVAGLANDLVNAGILTFGPSSQAAALEGSKNFMKDLCHKYNIPTAKDMVMETIIHPTVKGMTEEGCKFVGVLFAGLMIEKKSGLPKLIEFNVRFGDPECQVLMMRLESDLAKVLLVACRGELKGVPLDWSKDSAMVVVMASRGYPGAYEKGSIIRNLEEAERVAPGVKVFHAGTDLDKEGNVVASEGRVLGVTAKGKDLEEAQERESIWRSERSTGLEVSLEVILVGEHFYRNKLLHKSEAKHFCL